MEFMEPVLYGAGVIALLALAYLFWRASKTFDVLDTTLAQANKTLAEATDTLADLRSNAMPLITKAGVTVDAVNMELLRIDSIISTVENATKKVEKTSDSISGLVNTPVDVVTDFASRVRTVIRERRAEAQDARKSGMASGEVDDDEVVPRYVVLEESDLSGDYPTEKVVYLDELADEGAVEVVFDEVTVPKD
ncbi:MAG: hypothetical protein FWE87_00170 [Coriobacteriia bacterium]|nr:hypothetical protein [Coriobacteriia bacterium]